MTTSELSKSRLKEEYTCPIRQQKVVATPEEEVRQTLLSHLIENLGYPIGLISVEKELHSFGSQEKMSPPKRRLDVLCYAKQNDTLTPLLLIECKAVKLTRKAINQVASYNRFVQAPFIAIANQEEVRFGWLDPESQEYKFLEGLPHFDDLSRATAIDP